MLYVRFSMCGMKCLLCYWFCFIHLVIAEDRCRMLHFKDVYHDSAFNKSIIKNLTVHSEDECQIKCFILSTCKSYNLGPPAGPQGKRVCQLSSSRHVFHPKYLLPRPNFIYRPSEDSCPSPCPDDKTCFPDGGGYSCFCTNPGFQGERCDKDINECSAGLHDCGVNAQCTNNVGSFTCTCKDGFEGNGKACQDINECSTGAHDCGVNAQCTNIVGSFTCTCIKDGFEWNGKQCQVSSDFPFHWKFNGTDRYLNLRGAARFEEQDGRTVLYLDGTPGTYAETPALPFQQTDLTIGLWIKRFPSPSKRQMLYGDWSSPHQFRFDVMTDNRLCVDVRRESSVEERLLNFCTPRANTVPVNVWSHVAFTWGRAQHTGKLYIDGIHYKSAIADTNNEPVVDLKNSEHHVYDIGLKRDSRENSHAYFSDLWVFNRELSENEIRNELFLNHPLNSLT